jgi:endo-1,4-beta-xylanase
MRESRLITSAALGLAVLALLAEPGRAGAQPLVSSDFEDGTLQGWTARGGGVLLTNSDAAANTGTRSLLTTNRTAGFHGPSRDLLGVLQRDVPYRIRVSVRLTAPPPAPAPQVRMTVQRTPTGGAAAFDTVASSNTVTDAGFTTLVGTYRFTTDVTGLLLYVESTDGTASFYIDDFRVEEVVPDQSGLLCDFEDFTRNAGLYCFTTPEGVDRAWAGRGSAVLANTDTDAHNGSRSVLVTGRTATWNGPALDVTGKLTRGFRYRVNVWVKLAPGTPPTAVRLSLQRDGAGAATSFHTVVGDTTITDAAWVNLSTLYNMNLDYDALSLYVETSTDPAASFLIDDAEIVFTPPPPVQTDIPRVHEVVADHFTFGGAIEPDQVGSPRHAQLMRMHLNSLTAENAMKPGPIHPRNSTPPSDADYNFAGADTIANFARANGMTMRGHTLQWHQQNPAWLFQDAAGNPLTPSDESKALMLQRLEDHIRAVVGRYRDVVTSWDVVNEVIDASQPDGLRRSPWYDLTGSDFIDRAFQVAREVAGPDARLCINDFSTTDPAKRQALLNVVQGMLDRGVSVDCVGHQMHVNVAAPSLGAIRTTLETFAALGLDNQITEMDVSGYTNSTSTAPLGEETLVLQGYRYRDIFREYRRASGSISTVTLWGIADDHTWLTGFPIARPDRPLLFDLDLQAKHAYWGVVDPLRLPVVNQRLNVVQGSPRIGGLVDDVWGTTGAVTVGDGTGPTASFKLLWDESHLYVLAEVQDASRSHGDRLEVFVDENNGKTTSYEADDALYEFDRFGRCRGRWRRGPVFRVLPIPGGYRVEAKIRVDAALAAGSQVGFDLRVTDGHTATTVAWNDFTLSQDTDTSKWGTLDLLPGNRIAEAVRGTPLVDGEEDRVWDRASEIATGTFVLGTSGATARIKALWDDGRLYVLAKVTDPLLSRLSANPWEHDSVEIFLDQNNAKTPSYEADDGQYRVNFENTQSFGGGASAAKLASAVKLVPGGYVLEAAIALDAVEARAGTLLGFDVQVNDDGLGDGVRTSVATWNDPTGQSFNNTSRFGVLRLVRNRGHGHGAGWD